MFELGIVGLLIVAGSVIWLFWFGLKTHSAPLIILPAIAIAIFVIPLLFSILFVGCTTCAVMMGG